MFGICLITHAIRVDDSVGICAATQDNGSHHGDHRDDDEQSDRESIAVLAELEVLDLTEGVVAQKPGSTACQTLGVLEPIGLETSLTVATRHVFALIGVLVGADRHEVEIALAGLLNDEEVAALGRIGLIRGVGLDRRGLPHLVGQLEYSFAIEVCGKLNDRYVVGASDVHLQHLQVWHFKHLDVVRSLQKEQAREEFNKVPFMVEEGDTRCSAVRV